MCFLILFHAHIDWLFNFSDIEHFYVNLFGMETQFAIQIDFNWERVGGVLVAEEWGLNIDIFFILLLPPLLSIQEIIR